MVMTRSTVLALAGGGLLAVTITLLAQDGTPAAPVATGQDPTFRARVNVVLAPTTVTDRDGNYVQGLKPSEFELRDNGKLQETTVTESIAPISLVVAIQADAKTESVLPKVQKIGSLLEPLLAGDQGEVAILSFDHRIQTLQDFTSDTNKLEAALQKLRPGSSTSRLNDAVEEASRMLGNRPKTRRRLVLLISESRDKGSEGKLRETLTSTQVNDVMVYSLNMSRLFNELTTKPAYPRPDSIPATARNVPGGGVQTPTSVAQMTGTQGYGANFVPLFTEIFKSAKSIFVDSSVDVFTKYTGGKEFSFLSQRALEDAVGAIGREIHNQYLISYNPNNKIEGGFHTIEVTVRRRGLDVRTRPGYWAAAQPQ
jgi:VWFA-related protein